MLIFLNAVVGSRQRLCFVSSTIFYISFSQKYFSTDICVSDERLLYFRWLNRSRSYCFLQKHFWIKTGNLSLTQSTEIGVVDCQLPRKQLRCNMSRKKEKKSNFRLLKMAFILVILAILAVIIQGRNPFTVICQVVSFLKSV